MNANMSIKVSHQSDKLRTSKRQFIIVCAVLIFSTVTACLYAVRTEHHRELLLSSREALKLHEFFQIQLVAFDSAVSEVADVLHFDRLPNTQEYSRLNRRILLKNPLLHSLGWVRGTNSLQPRSLHSLYDGAVDDLSALWELDTWQRFLESAVAAKGSVASPPLMVTIEGEAQYVTVYLVPVDSAVPVYDGEPLVGGFAFGVVQMQKAFVASVSTRQEIPARAQLLDSPSAENSLEVAVSLKDDTPLSVGHEAVTPLLWGGRVMQLRLTPTQEYVTDARSFVPWFVGGLGLVLFALVFRLYRLLEQMAASQRTELRRRELELERNQRETNALIDVAPVAIVVLNGEGRIVGQSRTSITLSRDQSLGEIFEEIAIDGTFETLDGEPVKVRDNPALRALRGERIVNLQLVQHREERDCYFSFSASPIYDSEGEVSGSVCVSSDVSDLVQSIESQKFINTQLESSNQRLQQFASVASHDLQEPLRKITSFASLLEMEIGDQLSEQPKQYLDYLVDGAKRMSVLIRDILHYSEITPGTEGLETVDLAEAFAAIESELSGIVAKSGAEVSVRNSLPLYTSARMLPRLLGNLISNSIKYKGDSAPVIEIEAKQQLGGVLLSLSDNGMGIPEEYREQVFNMFKRLHSNSSIPGTGIGLSICKQIVELNGGRIWIEDNRPGGSRFMMFFPECGRAAVVPT